MATMLMTGLHRRHLVPSLLILFCLAVDSFSPSLKPFQPRQRNLASPSWWMTIDPEEQRTVADDDVDSPSKGTTSWWKRSLNSVKNGINVVVRKVRNFRKSSKTLEGVDDLFSVLRNSTSYGKLQEKYKQPDTSFARVEIDVDDFVMGESDFDIDKVIAALQSLNRLLLKNGTLWELASQFTGSWRISTTNTTLEAFNISLFPLIIPNLSLSLRDPEKVQLVKLYGDFEVDTQLQMLEFRFHEIEVLGIRRPLKREKTLGLGKMYKQQPTTTAARGRSPAAAAGNQTRPFQKKIATNETSESMNDVLSWFDEWYDEAISDEML